MKHKLIFKTMTIIWIFIMIFGMNTSTALPVGEGVQRYNPGLGWSDFFFIKGEATHAIFNFGDQDFQAGSWLSIVYGVTSGIIAADESDDVIVQSLYDFVLIESVWTNFFDGVDISDDVQHAILDHDPFIFYFEDEEGNLVKEIVLRAAYYVVPQNVGCYDYFGKVEFDGMSIETSNTFCWLPASVF